jgi:hypothetical protein
MALKHEKEASTKLSNEQPEPDMQQLTKRKH